MVHRKIGIILVTPGHFGRRRGRLSDSETLQINFTLLKKNEEQTDLKVRIVLIPLLHLVRGRSCRFPGAEALKPTLWPPNNF